MRQLAASQQAYSDLNASMDRYLVANLLETDAAISASKA